MPSLDGAFCSVGVAIDYLKVWQAPITPAEKIGACTRQLPSVTKGSAKRILLAGLPRAGYQDGGGERGLHYAFGRFGFYVACAIAASARRVICAR
jgi:hypothetical protein